MRYRAGVCLNRGAGSWWLLASCACALALFPGSAAGQSFEDGDVSIAEAARDFKKDDILGGFLYKYDKLFRPLEKMDRRDFLLAVYEYDRFARRRMERLDAGLKGLRDDLLDAKAAAGAARAAARDIAAVPAGTILMYGAEASPKGFLECDGSAKSRKEYPELFAVIGERFGRGDGTTTFNLPDLRGVFARGWDHAAGRDPHAAERKASLTGGLKGGHVGSYQDDAHGSMTLTIYSGEPKDVSGNKKAQFMVLQNPLPGGTPVETRPKNLALMYIIKH